MTEDQERPMEVMRLDNGLEPAFYDRSHTIAGDRKQVELVVRIPIHVKQSHFRFADDPESEYRRFVEACGEVVYFEQKKIRNFIDDKEVPKVLKELLEHFVRINRRYLSHSDFAAHFIRRRYDDWKDRQRYRSSFQ